jgi:hypothetical protein
VPARAAVTIGSNLATPATTNMNCNGVACTIANLSLIAANQAPGGLTSPVTGTVTSWRASAGGTATNVSLRVLTPGTGLTYTGGGASAPTTITGVSGPIASSVPIKAGDAVGLDSGNSGLVLGSNAGAAQAYWTLPTLGPGSTRLGLSGGPYETLVQAVVEPTNTLTYGKLKRNKKKGTARLTVNVPNPGQLSFSGRGIKVRASASAAVSAGPLAVTIKAKGKKAKKLARKGKLKVKLVFTYTPDNGSTKKQSKKVTLRKK